MTSPTPKSSDYINEQRLEYARYVLTSRTIPAITDGLRAGERRVLWKARDLGASKIKSVTLAGLALSLHPHDAPEDSVNSLAGSYRTNIPILTGHGSFGTLLSPNVYGASRYTSVSLSDFAKDVMFRDIEIIPMKSNYDNSEMEPECFLPLIPVALINPASGIVVGFSSNILPRSPVDIVEAQIEYLTTGKITKPLIPYSLPINSKATHTEIVKQGECWYFSGDYTQLTQTKIQITNIPYGVSHQEITEHLHKLEEEGTIASFSDRSSDVICIEIKFPSANFLKTKTKNEVLSTLKLVHREFERLLLVDYTSTKLLDVSPAPAIQQFTDWRLEWYTNRYEYLLKQVQTEYQRYLDIKTAIDNEVNKRAQTTKDRKLLIEYLRSIQIVNVDYIADLPIHRFTQQEYDKNEKRIGDAIKLMTTYEKLLKSEAKRKQAYVDDLTEILNNLKQGKYTLHNHG